MASCPSVARAISLALVALVPISATAAAEPGAIEVVVENVRSATGMVVVDICPEAKFLDECPWSGTAPARVGSVAVVVRGVPPGHYAAQGYHDANGNGKLDRGIFGIPREGAGFSRIETRLMRRPHFPEAAFDHGAGPQRIALRLNYY